jgi:hypothetical protein
VPIKSWNVQHRDQNDGSPRQMKVITLNQLPNGSRSIDFVTMQCRGHKNHRTVDFGPADMDGNLDRVAALAFPDIQMDVPRIARKDLETIPFVDRFTDSFDFHSAP